MKIKHTLLGLMILGATALTGCGNTIEYTSNLESYCVEMQYRDGFTIVQLTDIHWSTGTDSIGSKEYLTSLIDQIKAKVGKIDLIELSGDMFMLSNARTAKTFISFMESLKIPYAATWGNHDREGTYNPNWLSKKFMNSEYSLYQEVDYDDVYGRSNYIINIKDGSATKWQIAHLDSGASYNETALQFGRTYDYIRENQAKWWKAEHDLVGDDVPVIAYYHIPQNESQVAWDLMEEGNTTDVTKHKFNNYEHFSQSEEHAQEFFDIAKDHGLKAEFYGHDHANDWTVDYQGVTIGYGVKTGKELYYSKVSEQDAKDIYGLDRAFDLMGASVVTLHDGGNFDLDHFYYNMKADGDNFSAWVRY